MDNFPAFLHWIVLNDLRRHRRKRNNLIKRKREAIVRHQGNSFQRHKKKIGNIVMVNWLDLFELKWWEKKWRNISYLKFYNLWSLSFFSQIMLFLELPMCDKLTLPGFQTPDSKTKWNQKKFLTFTRIILLSCLVKKLKVTSDLGPSSIIKKIYQSGCSGCIWKRNKTISF